MGSAIRPVSVAERRARLATRHHLRDKAGSVAAAAADIIVLHGTDPASVYLSARARTQDTSLAAIEQALYDDGTLVRMLGMRRTVFVVPAGLAPVIQAACTDQIAARLRRQLTETVRKAGIAPDAEAWLREVGEGTIRALADHGPVSGTELARHEPRLRTQIIAAQDNPYGGAVNLTTRLLTVLSAEGLMVRGRPRGGWTSMQFTWSASDRTELAADVARADLAGRWLRAFGPAPVADLQWWAGWTATQTRQAVARLDTTEVDLDGITGLMLTGDEAPTDPRPGWAALLPALDPTPMGWRERSWFLGEHGPILFDRSGNIGPTVWWDGRIVGGWAQRPDGEIVVRLLEDTGVQAEAAIAAEADRLGTWLGQARVVPRFRTPLERELTARS
jgi:Winged helix DNA-binding domain